jgi:hypothetical protein
MAELREYNDVQEIVDHRKQLKFKKTLDGILKTHHSQNDCHPVSLDNQSNITANIFYNYYVAKFNPFFNKKI